MGWLGVSKKTVIFMWEKGDFEIFYDFARAGPVGWKVIGKLPGPVFNPCPPLHIIIIIISIATIHKSNRTEDC